MDYELKKRLGSVGLRVEGEDVSLRIKIRMGSGDLPKTWNWMGRLHPNGGEYQGRRFGAIFEVGAPALFYGPDEWQAREKVIGAGTLTELVDLLVATFKPHVEPDFDDPCTPVNHSMRRLR